MSDAHPTALSSSSSVTFDPLAVAPAFARTPSNAPPTEQQPISAPASSSTSSSDAPSRARLSVPALGDASLMGELPTTDPLSILLQKHLPPHTRPVRDLSGTWHTAAAASNQNEIAAPASEIPDPFVTGTEPSPAAVEVNAQTVRQAAASNAWRKIASLARTKLETYSHTERQRFAQQQRQLVDAPPHEDGMDVRQALEWWSVRLYALARLKLYSMLRTELAALWQVLATTPVEQQDGASQAVSLADSLEYVPFTLRVLKATEPKFRGEVRTTLEQYTLLIQLCKREMRRCRAASKTAAADVEREEVGKWRRRAERVGLMLAFTLAEAKDYAGAIEVVTPLIERSLRQQGTSQAGSVEERVQLVVVASRLFVQAGDLSSASSLLDRAERLLPTTTSVAHTHLAHARTLIHAISGDFPTASSFTPNTTAEHLNHAIIAFYSAHLDESLAQLEGVLAENPRAVASADAVVFNLATLYELGHGSEAQVVERKREVLDRLARCAGEPGVSGSSFKL